MPIFTAMREDPTSPGNNTHVPFAVPTGDAGVDEATRAVPGRSTCTTSGLSTVTVPPENSGRGFTAPWTTRISSGKAANR
ncbi:hypothetical protein JCM14720_13450 [Calditerricola yamamurae]